MGLSSCSLYFSTTAYATSFDTAKNLATTRISKALSNLILEYDPGLCTYSAHFRSRRVYSHHGAPNPKPRQVISGSTCRHSMGTYRTCQTASWPRKAWIQEPMILAGSQDEAFRSDTRGHNPHIVSINLAQELARR